MPGAQRRARRHAPGGGVERWGRELRRPDGGREYAAPAG
ncbi:hypothetical protein BSIN_2626 [Burkholderia singularis]|uniref:Uncharacterized protein n=1 Tax=Burkholderia singularis TaxID=1503053 RepID=A0A238HBY9_9BURK|nr:hypothetical protein BSIN_2626 [Burkholderia singularis]